jgi:hypothetical protein
VAVAAADRLENTYLPPKSAQTASGAGFLNAPRPGGGGGRGGGGAGGGGGGGAGGVNPNAKIGIIRFDSDNPGDGSYKYR